MKRVLVLYCISLLIISILFSGVTALVSTGCQNSYCSGYEDQAITTGTIKDRTYTITATEITANTAKITVDGQTQTFDKNAPSDIFFGNLKITGVILREWDSPKSFAFSVSSKEPYCTDSDVTSEFPDGINPYVYGTVDSSGYLSKDSYQYSSDILEYYCDGNTAKYKSIACEYGRSDIHANYCIKTLPNGTCEDSDNGKDYYNLGTTSGYNIWTQKITSKDYCILNADDKKTLFEGYCDGIFIKFDNFSCPGVCSNGVCVNAPPVECDTFKKKCADGTLVGKNPANNCSFYDCTQIKLNNTEPPKNITIPENITQPSKCSHCELDGNCYDLGNRKNGKYCSEAKEFLIEKDTGNQCTENYECSSYLCKNDVCEKRSFWQKIVDGFRSLFGRK